jgi:hypothetical protein
MVGGGSFTGVTCSGEDWSELVSPTGGPLTGYELEGDFFVQRVHVWQAPCRMATADEEVLVTGAWGDNLSGDAKLKVGSPIRVEIVLTEAASGDQLPGYTVVKLEPAMLDRESPYGTLATSDDDGLTWHATADLFVPLVYAAGATLTVQNLDTGVFVPNTDASAEINATGKIVYGYNLRVTAAGTYEIKYHMPRITFLGCDEAGSVCMNGDASLVINVIGGGGGGGGKKGGK